MSKFNFKVINMNADSNIPVFKESSNKNWIDYGSNNLYPQFLLDIYHNRCNKHKAIVNKKSMMIAGNGFDTIENASDDYNKFVSNIFSDKNLEEIASKLAYDLMIYGGYSLKIKWSRDRTKIASIDYIPFQKVRLSTNDDKLWVSKDWKNYRRNGNTPVEVAKFSLLTKDENPVQILYVLEDQPGMDYYSIPEYSSTLNYIEMSYEIGNFHLNSIKNGFSGGFILNFATGIPSMEEMDEAYKEFEKKYTGSGNAGKFILTFSDGKDGAPELSPIELNATDERFILLNELTMQEIMIGHQVVSPMIFGVRSEGQLGGRDEILEAMALFQSTYIDFKQNKIESTLNKLGNINHIKENIVLAKYKLFPSEDENKNIQ